MLVRRGIAGNIAPALPRIECGRIADMADYTHTIDRWDEATGVIEQIAGVTDMAGGRWPLVGGSGALLVIKSIG